LPVREIQLSRGKIAIVDDEDYERVSAFKWYAYKHRRTDLWYAARTVKKGGKKISVPMHRFVIGASPEFEVDHRDGDGLNNRRGNLREATRRQNAQNARHTARGTKTSPYHGVSIDKSGKYLVVIVAGELKNGSGKQMYIGRYRDEIEAARAYDRAAIKHFGEFAKTNFPVSEYEGQSLEIVRPPRATRRGASNPRAKLTEADVIRIRSLVADGHPQSPLALEYGVDKALIGRIVHRKSWKHI
jgi:hypothetical protein